MVETETSKRLAEKFGAGSADYTARSRVVARGEDVFGEAPKTAGGAPAVPGGISPLTWLNLVCLDASLVAVSWQWLFARTFQVELIGANISALFLTAWLIYLVDRLGDSMLLRRGMPMSLRQRFCLRHRKLWIAGTVLVAIADLAAIVQLDLRTTATGSLLGLVALAYLLVNHRASRLWRSIPAKELIIGFLFAVATIASLAPRFPGVSMPFALASFSFACLCSLNCICIARWECELDHAQKRNSLATAWPALARNVSVAAVVLAICGVALAIFYRAELTLFLLISLSALALVSLDRFGDRLQADTRTACADLVLLTPLVLLLIGART